MSLVLRKPLTHQQFFSWAQSQQGRYEFDGLQPVGTTGGTTGGTLGHNQITLAVHRALERRLAGGSCTPLGLDAGVATIGDIVRYPDAVVTSSTFDQSDQLVPVPVIVLEVVSPGSLRLDRVVKLREYQAVVSIRAYVIVESGAAAVHRSLARLRRRPVQGGRPDRGRHVGPLGDRRLVSGCGVLCRHELRRRREFVSRRTKRDARWRSGLQTPVRAPRTRLSPAGRRMVRNRSSIPWRRAYPVRGGHRGDGSILVGRSGFVGSCRRRDPGAA